MVLEFHPGVCILTDTSIKLRVERVRSEGDLPAGGERVVVGV